MGMTGYNPDQVKGVLDGYIRKYDSLSGDLDDFCGNAFVLKMASVWACKEAQKFFANYKETVESCVNKVNSLCEGFYTNMVKSIKIWELQTGTAASNLLEFTVKNLTIDIDVVKENINGNRGVDVESATEYINQLKSGLSLIIQILKDCFNIYRDAGFVGGGQKTAIEQAASETSGELGKIFTVLIEDISKAITNTVNVYGDTAGKIASSFGELGQGGSVSSDVTETRVVDSSSGVVIDWNF